MSVGAADETVRVAEVLEQLGSDRDLSPVVRVGGDVGQAQGDTASGRGGDVGGLQVVAPTEDSRAEQGQEPAVPGAEVTVLRVEGAAPRGDGLRCGEDTRVEREPPVGSG